MHTADGTLTTQGLLLLSACGVVLLALACVTVAYLLVRFSVEDRHAMARAAETGAVFAPRGDAAERRDDADDQAVVSQVRRDLTRDLHRRPAPTVARRRAESRESRPVPPAVA